MTKGAVFVTVRSGSSRLPGKALMEIKGKSTIERVIERAQKASATDLVIVCTTNLPEDDQICEIANRCGAKVFRGSVMDKLSRWLGAAHQFGVDYFVTADGDDLFCEPKLNDLALNQFRNGSADFIQSSHVIPGAFTYGIRTSALERVCEIKDSDDTEMMWVYFTQTGLFSIEELDGELSPYMRKNVRITLDYQEDFDFFAKVYDALYDQFPEMPLVKVFEYLDSNPQVTAINSFFNNVWAANQVEKTQLVLKPQYQHLIK